MARLRSSLTRRTGAVGIAISAYRLWKMIPRKQRQRIMKGAVKHGPRIATKAAKRVGKRRRPRVKP